MDDVLREWQEYERGLDYKRKINLFAKVDKNERFYGDDQWSGVQANGLPTPQYNQVARISYGRPRGDNNGTELLVENGSRLVATVTACKVKFLTYTLSGLG